MTPLNRHAVCFLLLLSVLVTPTQTAFAQTPEPQIFIRLNQMGFRPLDPKSVVAFARNPLPPKFSVVNAQTSRVVFDGVTNRLAGRWGQFDYHAELDLSSLRQPGQFFIRIGTSQSQQFEIRSSTYAEVPDQLLEFMRQQRCGYNPWLDAVCHSFDGRTAYGPLAAGTYVDARGGWHDAGDLLKYLLTSSNATAQMLLAYQTRPSRFQDRYNAFGQPGAKWNR